MENNDPERRGRIRVQCPAVLGDYLSAWCEPCIPYATDYAGDYYVPPVGEGIWVQFEEGDPNKPIWNGGWYKVNSSPLTKDSTPDDYRFIIFKDSVIRMGQREFIFELRDGETSYTVTISPTTWLGLNYISSYDEDKIRDLETLVINKDWILSQRPEEVNQMFSELQGLIASLSSSYNDFTQNIFPQTVDEIYNEINKSYEAGHSELEEVVSQINGYGGIKSDITDLSQTTESLNRAIQKLSSLVNRIQIIMDSNSAIINKKIVPLYNRTIGNVEDLIPELKYVEESLT